MKITIDKSKGPVVFLGSMNAMPMMYALELKKLGVDVLYFVDVPIEDTLSRPENHFSEISYPYPSWITEINIKSQILLPLFRKKFAESLDKKIDKLTSKPVQAYILNGFFISLSSYLKSNSPKISLSHGSDLDTWADMDGAVNLSSSFNRKSIFKFMPKFISLILIKKIVSRQFHGFASSDGVIYFPKGFNSYGDRVISKLKNKKIQCYERYDISFNPLKKQSRTFKASESKLVIFSGVRFIFDTFLEGNDQYNKGNDLIIEGLSKFYKDNKNILIHFVDKGPDVDKAKTLCEKMGIEEVVIWHKEMKFTELLKIYDESHICFDQVGKHWIGAIGGYAMWLGKPLIANDSLPVNVGFWPKNNPVCSAKTADEVCEWLCKLQNNEVREKISLESKKFVEEYMGPEKLLFELFQFNGDK